MQRCRPFSSRSLASSRPRPQAITTATYSAASSAASSAACSLHPLRPLTLTPPHPNAPPSYTYLTGERNYHIFYHVLLGAGLLSSADPKQQRLLNRSSCTSVPNVDDAEEYRQLVQAMADIGMADQENAEVQRCMVTPVLTMAALTMAALTMAPLTMAALTMTPLTVALLAMALLTTY